MKDIMPALIVAAGGFCGLFGALMLLEARKSRMDKKDKKGNIFGAVFLFTIAILIISGGISVWLSPETTKNTIKDIDRQAPKAVSKEDALPITAQEQPQQTQEKIQTQNKKQEAEKAVKSFAQVQKTFNYVLTSYQSDIKNISNGTMDTVVYINLDRLSQQALDLFSIVKSMDITNQYASEKQTMVTAVLYLLGSIDNLKGYMDDKKISKYTEAQDFLQKAVEANKLVTLGVAKQALIDGYNPQQ
ncbi:MAG: stage II sporulation protein M [Peptococcaceae bacterium]|nr:stage II sporulation protein M [Peptococcaceae bacterium]